MVDSGHYVNAVSVELLGSIRSFIQSSIASSLDLSGHQLRLEAHLEPRDSHGGRTKRWSRIIDISNIANDLVTPPPSAVGDDTELQQSISEENGTTIDTYNHHSPELQGSQASQSPTLNSEESAAGVQTHRDGTGKRSATGTLKSTAKRRKAVASDLRPAITDSTISSARQLENSDGNVPQRKQYKDGQPRMQPSTLDKFIVGIWENLYKKNDNTKLDVSNVIAVLQDPNRPGVGSDERSISSRFQDVNILCSRVTKASSYVRGLELMIQAYWIDCFNARVRALSQEQPDITPAQHKKATLVDACRAFGWAGKELRNRMAIWKGYHELKNAAGWSALVFSGAGIYRFCKYRVAFDANSLSKLGRQRWRFEVAADTMHPEWRRMLDIIGVQSRKIYYGHPLDWVVSKTTDPVPLSLTYRQWDPCFKFEHIDDCVLDHEAWGEHDPRLVQVSRPYICQDCNNLQSGKPDENQCQCFSEIFGSNKHYPLPVQVYATEDGRNNGLMACCDFPRGSPIAEFLGLITRDLSSVDVMTSPVRNTYLLSSLSALSSASASPSHPNSNPRIQSSSSSSSSSSQNHTYQIYQNRQGNYTRFVNHSCLPNSQYQKFTWLGLERIVLVSKGISAGMEITADYSDRYWKGLDKKCLCGKAYCRYR